GRYANYLWGAHNRLPVALATPSLFTFYEQPPLLSNALVVGVSQSGKSPDIVRVIEEGRAQGCLTLTLTNIPDSPLARAADFVVDLQCGEEKAVAATKTYTAELAAIAMLSVALAQDEARLAELQRAPDWMRQVLALDAEIARLAERYRYMERCAVIGRGFNYCTAFEWSLKIKELTYVTAEPYSSADFRHGPIAIVEQGFPMLVVVPGGKVYGDLLDLLKTLRGQGAELVVISDQPEALALAQSPFQLPAGIPEWLTPLIAILPAQLFAYHLTRVKGYNTEAPRSIRKVTETH
ncbi:MAG TPA: SIS domain-containing protein, partial [Anaerolineales bacterium]|nr:SIS domain-containing protein [Anaerolineales bacterium]